MMRFTLGAYWDARPDSVDKCAASAADLFARLAEIDPLLANWYEPGRSRKDALRRKVGTSDIHTFRELLLKGRYRRDVGREVIEDLGFRIGFWNGAGVKEAEASLDIHCGCYSEYAGNNVIINLPYVSQGVRWVQNASTLLASIAKIWQPKWAGIMSMKAISERDYDADRPFVDWMVYVPRSVPAMPSPSRVGLLKDLGSIVVVQPDPPVGEDAEELSRIRRVESLLRTQRA